MDYIEAFFASIGDSIKENISNELIASLLADGIIALVEQVLESKAKDSNADTSELESKIDSLVYRLYNLTDEEIQIIEKNN